MNEILTFIAHYDGNENQIRLPDDEYHHLVRVLRCHNGDEVYVINGKGLYARGKLLLKNKYALVEILHARLIPRPTFEMILLFSPLASREKNEWIIEKAVELQCTKIIFYQSRYSVRHKINYQRLNKVAIAALKQSKNPYLPEMNEKILSFEEAMDLPFENTSKYIAWCEATPENHLLKKLSHPKNSLIVIGPEGGFDPVEIKRAQQSGFEPVSLSGLRLRSETAAIYALSVIHAKIFYDEKT